MNRLFLFVSFIGLVLVLHSEGSADETDKPLTKPEAERRMVSIISQYYHSPTPDGPPLRVFANSSLSQVLDLLVESCKRATIGVPRARPVIFVMCPQITVEFYFNESRSQDDAIRDLVEASRDAYTGGSEEARRAAIRDFTDRLDGLSESIGLFAWSAAWDVELEPAKRLYLVDSGKTALRVLLRRWEESSAEAREELADRARQSIENSVLFKEKVKELASVSERVLDLGDSSDATITARELTKAINELVFDSGRRGELLKVDRAEAKIRSIREVLQAL